MTEQAVFEETDLTEADVARGFSAAKRDLLYCYSSINDDSGNMIAKAVLNQVEEDMAWLYDKIDCDKELFYKWGDKVLSVFPKIEKLQIKLNAIDMKNGYRPRFLVKK